MVKADAALLAAPGVDERAASGASARRLRALVASYQEFIWRSLGRLGVPPAQVEDATQEVFCVAMRHIDRIDRERERSFLFGVAMRVASDARRAHTRSRERADQQAVDAAVAHQPTPEALLDDRRLRELLDEALETLEDDTRVVFVLYELEGLTGPEIASLLAVPIGTVASRLRRGRERFHAAAARLRARLTRGGSP
jgi:RNA polymerase sigma-70 factor (ECF subfamily)